MQDIPYTDGDYCQYSNWGYQKPTRFWGSPEIADLKLRLCDGIHCPNLLGALNTRGTRKHRITLSSKHQNLPVRLKYRIPPRLVEELAGFEPTLATLQIFDNPTPICSCLTQDDCKCPGPPKIANEPTSQVNTITLPERLLGSPESFVVGEVTTFEGKRQLFLTLSATLPDRSRVNIDALVDTGAEANLIKKGLITEKSLSEPLSPSF